MAYLPSSRFSAVFCLSIVLLFGGCCANDECNCPNEQADAIELRFASNFTAADLDTVLILRYPLVTTPRTVPETVTLVQTGTQRRDSIILNNTTPFAQAGTAKLNRYHYEVKYYTQQPGHKPVATNALTIDSVHVRGSYDGNGCCTCYSNTEKTVFARDSVYTLTGQSRAILKVTR